MKALYASKLYQASTRKDRIHAAIIAPSNLALVQQLAEDLDEDYQTSENFGIKEESESSEPDNKSDSEEDDLFVNEKVDPSKDLITMDDVKTTRPSSHSSNHSLHDSSSESDVSSDADEPEDNRPDSGSSDNSQLMPESPANEKSTEETNSSTKINATTNADLTILRDTLNSREDTSGVNRIALKDNEVWIYYKDDINLNNVMTEVIELVMNSGYESFEFNRLARSDNAIVFVIVNETDLSN